MIPWATPSIVAVVVWRMILDPQVGVINKYMLEWRMQRSPSDKWI